MPTSKQKNATIKILIADDHPVFRQGLKHIFNETSDISVEGEAENGQAVLQAVRNNDFNVVLLDISLPGKTGLEILTELKKERPKLPALILTIYPEDLYGVRMIKAGASGYLVKSAPPSQLIEAVRKVAGGGKYISPVLAEQLAIELDPNSESPPHTRLSDREYQVMCLIASGKTVSEIASELNLGVTTISGYRAHILEKMKLKNNAQIMYYVLSKGLTE